VGLINMETLFVVGRLIYGVPLLYMGISNFWRLDKMTEDARAKGIPMPELAAICGMIWLIIGVLAIILNYFALIGGIMVAVFLVISGIKIHDYWTVTDPKIRHIEMTQFEKNIIIAGAALAIAAVDV
jgi:putative oxidoreductase